MSITNNKVLIADDEPDILELLKYNFETAGYEIQTATNGEIAIEIAQTFKPDLIILDIMMPVIDGIETCRLLRDNELFKNTFIIFLTARSEEYSEVAAFQNGADDYLVKPIKPRALLSRVDAYFRRSATKSDNTTDIINIKDLSINRTSFQVSIEGKSDVVLPKKEFEVLYYLAKKAGRVFSREELLNKIWGTDVAVTPRTVDVHIRKIREKLGEKYIKTIKGVGYKFDTE
jgi:two-component system, OmpR family, alkaline phosphatase synthesis response regulator PhoP